MLLCIKNKYIHKYIYLYKHKKKYIFYKNCLHLINHINKLILQKVQKLKKLILKLLGNYLYL